MNAIRIQTQRIDDLIKQVDKHANTLRNVDWTITGLANCVSRLAPRITDLEKGNASPPANAPPTWTQGPPTSAGDFWCLFEER
jgi:hypothetical protein